jgi:hypothetical protein
VLILSYHLRLQAVCFLQVLPPKAYMPNSSFPVGDVHPTLFDLAT